MFLLYLMIALQVADAVKYEYYRSDQWGYRGINGVGSWGIMYPVCKNGSRQSPINIEKSIVETIVFVKSLQFKHYDTSKGIQKLTNVGSTVILTMNDAVAPSISGAGLKESYIFKQLHFHWGKNSTVGSEHTVANKTFPAELHFLHWRKSYGSFEEAADREDGLAVLSVFFKISETNNSALDGIVSVLKEVQYKDEFTTKGRNVILKDLIPQQESCYFRYFGSLTVPPCTENVVWTIFKNPIEISELQLNEFRNLYSTNKDVKDRLQLADNFRPIQKVNSRKVNLPFRCRMYFPNLFSFEVDQY